MDARKMQLPISVLIPTYGRGQVLVETLRQVLAQSPSEILLLDQTPEHEPRVARILQDLSGQGKLRWIRREKPSIPGALNAGLLAAREELVLLLDDDVLLSPGLLAAHCRAHHDRPEAGAVVGQILQPGQNPEPLAAGESFRFNATEARKVGDLMAGNLSLKKTGVLQVGGFDENFVAVAFKFESEFGRRLERAGSELWFEPTASLRHLRASRGGTRSFGSHLRTLSPDHAVGAYYYLMLENNGRLPPGDVIRRLRKTLCTRYHLRRPWWLPMLAVAELRAAGWAIQLFRQGQKLLPPCAGQLLPPVRSAGDTKKAGS